MTRRIISLPACMLAVTVIALAQTPSIPAQQTKFCSILNNWKLRGGYAPGQEPKVDPNPIVAARAPKPPSPGDMFDQLVEVLGPSGAFTGWKGSVTFNVQGQVVWIGMGVTCPEGLVLSLNNSFDHRAWTPLDSPIAGFLSTIKADNKVTFSGHLVYDPATKFYKTGLGWNPRQGMPNIMASPVASFFTAATTFEAQFTGISK